MNQPNSTETPNNTYKNSYDNTHLIEIAISHPLYGLRFPVWQGRNKLYTVNTIPPQRLFQHTKWQRDDDSICLVRGGVCIGAGMGGHHLYTSWEERRQIAGAYSNDILISTWWSMMTLMDRNAISWCGQLWLNLSVK